MAKPSFADYVNIISNLVDNFMKHHLDFASRELRCLYTYKQLYCGLELVLESCNAD